MKTYFLLALAIISQNLCGQTEEIYDSTFLNNFSILAKRQCLFPTMLLPDTQQLKTLNFSYFICNPKCTLVRVIGYIKEPNTDEGTDYYDSVRVDYLLSYEPIYVQRYRTQTIHYFRKIYGFRYNDKKNQKQVAKIIKSDSMIQKWLWLPQKKLRKSLRKLKKGCSECLIDSRFLIHRRRY